jgi:hypothetical protein
MDLREIVYEVIDWNRLAQDKIQWWISVNFRVPEEREISCASEFQLFKANSSPRT